MKFTFKVNNDSSYLKEEMDFDMQERKRRRAQAYRKYANIEENAPIDMDNLNEWALNAAGCEGRCSVEDIKEALRESYLVEDDMTVGQMAAQVDAEKVIQPTDSVGQIEAALDRALKVAKRRAGVPGSGYPNVLFVSEAGMGKTAVCRAWARANGVNLVEVRASTLDPTDIGGLFAPPDKDSKRARKISTGEFDQLDSPNSVLFLDEFNRANKSVRGALLELVNSHFIPDSSEAGGQRFLPNFLFTIATMNPPTANYNADNLDQAELSRFRNVNLTSDNRYILKYLEKTFDKAIADSTDPEDKMEYEGRKALAQKLLTSKKFIFDDAADIEKGRDRLDYNFHPLNYRSLTNLLEMSDGTKEDFLALWDDMVNPLKKDMAELILADYVDVKDKANSVLEKPSESDVFKKKRDPLSMIRDAHPELNI